MKLIEAIKGCFADPPSPLPAHVDAVKLDVKLLLHMADADKPSKRTESGFVKPRTI